MNFGIAMLLSVLIPTSGIIMLIIGKPLIKQRTNKKLPLRLCNIWCILSILIYVSFLLAPAFKHHNSRIYYEQYMIDKVTMSTVYFHNDEKQFNDSNVILEDPVAKYENIVIVEKEDYSVYWLLGKINTTSVKYHVYLSNDVCQRYKDGNVIYKNIK